MNDTQASAGTRPWPPTDPVMAVSGRAMFAPPMFAAAEPGDCTWTQADLEDADQPVPYTLTAKAEALLAHAADPDAGAGS